ncbi:MAG: hypothetical protein ACUVUG_07210 [Candidatus Aminicenantia bacterium]
METFSALKNSRGRIIIYRGIIKDIKPEIVLDPSLLPVMIEETPIEQIILNLAVNSREAMASGGKFIISTKNIYLTKLTAGIILS